jgi:hypothetical protein
LMPQTHTTRRCRACWSTRQDRSSPRRRGVSTSAWWRDSNHSASASSSRNATASSAIIRPRFWTCHGLEEVYSENAEPVPGPTTRFLGSLASELGIYLLGGSILEGGSTSIRLHNTSTFFRPDGEMSAVYRKVHLFDVELPDGDVHGGEHHRGAVLSEQGFLDGKAAGRRGTGSNVLKLRYGQGRPLNTPKL